MNTVEVVKKGDGTTEVTIDGHKIEKAIKFQIDDIEYESFPGTCTLRFRAGQITVRNEE